MMHASPIGDIARRCAFEPVLGKCFERRIQQFLLGPDAALLLFSWWFFGNGAQSRSLMRYF
jgi:hypothetical protein